ncbi:jg13440 [Pararge aegeria aegeria]|uniref:Jg13440 protein n=1 Tax=Pararge aegeria aegeria TaxID=348720 RepID=A0A8S4S3I3_9NEOP|nr:jg13440 [Pararge aegeria aegeria]
MDVSKNGLFIVTGSHDRTAKLWSLDRTFPVRVFVGHTSDVIIKVWDLAACNCVHEYRGHHGKVTALDWSAVGKQSLTNRVSPDPNNTNTDNSILCSAGMDGIVKAVWDSCIKNKQVSSQDISTSIYNTKCSYLVDVQVHPEWLVAIGAKQ